MLLCACAVTTFGQVEIVDRDKDFGILRRADDHWVDFEIKNSTPEEVVIFRVRGSKNTDIKLSSKTIAPGASEFVRVAVSPTSVGKFHEKMEIYLSAWQKPQNISLKGESTFAVSSLIPCPDFGSKSQGSSNEFFVSIRDVTQNPIHHAQINIYKDGRKTDELKTNEHGEATVDLPYGRYFFSIVNDGSRIDTALYVNAVNNHLVAFVDVVAPMPEVEEFEVEYTMPPPEPIIKVVEEEVEEVIDEEEEYADLEEDIPLPSSKYKENNLVFLIDVSASMKQHGRMDLLKIAMIELLDILRPYDKFSLITYASDTEVLIEATQNLDKEACASAILSLEPKGSTEGAKAINKAGKVALKHFVNGGNNQIIMATDGAFTSGVNKALRHVAKYDRRDVMLSILGIKCGTFTTRQMTTLVEQGRGRYIPIDAAEDAGSQLIEEIKKSSIRGL